MSVRFFTSLARERERERKRETRRKIEAGDKERGNSSWREREAMKGVKD